LTGRNPAQWHIICSMLYRSGATAVLLLHFAFIVFVLLGGLIALRWRRAWVVHLPAAAWGCFVELTGRTCPLTYAENFLRSRADQSEYSQGFIEHYLLAVIYPEGLTQNIQFVLGGGVALINLLIYWWVLRRGVHGRPGRSQA
jgi:Protein of Unknown function (DUF2784)